MRVAVIGAGVVGVTTAYYLAQHGHQVSVIEQCGNVCEQASLGHAGLLGPAHLAPLAAPGMVGQILSQWLKSDGAVNLRPSLQLNQWRWLRSWLRECNLEQLIARKTHLQRLGSYSQQQLSVLSNVHNLDFQSRQGVLQLFRQSREQSKITAGLAVLTDAGIPFHLLDEAACYQQEPALNHDRELAGGLFMPGDGSGNCALFTKQLKQLTQQWGVEYLFSTECLSLHSTKTGISLQLTQAQQSLSRQFDAVVIAAGADSGPLLKALGMDLRLAQFKSYSITSGIKNPEDTPGMAIVDEAEHVAMTRMDKRLRVSGTIQFHHSKPQRDERAWQTLRNVATHWFPDAANYHTAQYTSTRHLMLPGGAPILGVSAMKNVYLNMAHAENGWALATGSGKIVADLVSGLTPEIDLEGLCVLR